MTLIAFILSVDYVNHILTQNTFRLMKQVIDTIKCTRLANVKLVSCSPVHFLLKNHREESSLQQEGFLLSPNIDGINWVNKKVHIPVCDIPANPARRQHAAKKSFFSL